MNEVKNKCKYLSIYTGWNCPYEALEDSKEGFCIFHERRKDKDRRKFDQEIKRIGPDKDTKAYHFEGFFFPASVYFSHLNFGAEVYFYQAEFHGDDTYFIRTRFLGTTHFNGVKCLGQKITFMEAEFSGANTYFTGTEFGGKAVNFLGTIFKSVNTDFSSAEFKADDTFFVGAKFLGNAVNFYDSRFLKTVWFDRTIFDAKTRFSNIDLRKCVLLSVDLRNVDLDHLYWDWNYKIGNEGELEKVQAMLNLRKQKLYFITSEIYQQLKVHFHNKRDFAKVGLFHFREQECKRKACELPQGLFQWIFLWILRLSCGYGEKVRSVGWTSGIFIFVFAFFYMFLGLHNVDSSESLIFRYELSFKNIVPVTMILKDFWTSLLFSVKGFFPLWRFQQYKVVGDFANLVAGFEFLLGTFMVGLFIYVFRRQWVNR